MLGKLITLLLLSSISLLPVQAEELTAEQIMQGINNLLNQPTVYSQGKMIIQTSSGQERVFTMNSWSVNGGEKTLMRYTAPSRVRGQSTLMLNHSDEIWIYFPRTGRVRKLAAHARYQKMEGSDFTYEDMGSGDTFVEDFTPVLIGLDKKCDTECYYLELFRKEDSRSAYNRLLIWARKTDFMPLLIDYYPEENSELPSKRLFQSDVTVVQGIPTAGRVEMHNLLDNTVTVMETDSIRYNLEIPEDFFTTRNLQSQ
jgi:hypothetical protein